MKKCILSELFLFLIFASPSFASGDDVAMGMEMDVSMEEGKFFPYRWLPHFDQSFLPFFDSLDFPEKRSGDVEVCFDLPNDLVALHPWVKVLQNLGSFTRVSVTITSPFLEKSKGVDSWPVHSDGTAIAFPYYLLPYLELENTFKNVTAESPHIIDGYFEIPKDFVKNDYVVDTINKADEGYVYACIPISNPYKL